MSTLLRPFSPRDHAAARGLWQATPGVGLSGADEARPSLFSIGSEASASPAAWAGPGPAGSTD